MTTGNTGNGSIPPNGENPADFSQYSLYQLVGLLREHLSKFNSQATSLPEGTNGSELGTLRQSLSELALSLSTQNKKLFNGGNQSFIIDKITYVNDQLDAQEKLLNKWENVRSKQTAKILDTLFEIRNRVPKGDELVPSGLDESQYEYLNIIRRRSKYLKYDPDQQDDYLTFLYKLLADELARNKKVNAELIPKKEKVYDRKVDTFFIRAEFKDSWDTDTKGTKLQRDEPAGLLDVVDPNKTIFDQAKRITNKGRRLFNEGKWGPAMEQFKTANDLLKPIVQLKDEFATLFHTNTEMINTCEQQRKGGKGRKRGGLFGFIFP